jgi:hypothetical protein
MATNEVGTLSKHHKLFKQLGTSEPTTTIEAEAVLEHIREEKGYIDPDFEQALNGLAPLYREKVFKFLLSKKKTEAAYTKRYDPIYSYCFPLNSVVYPNNSTPRIIASCTSLSKMLKTQNIAMFRVWTIRRF